VDFIVDRYGEYVLLRPTTSGSNLILWIAAPVLFVIALLGAVLYLRDRARQKTQVDDLSDAERKRLEELLKE
jgi:cytochrome c-type biogenesis protein CcmH